MDIIHIGAQGTPTALPLVDSDEKRALGHLKKILTDTPGFIYKIGISTNPRLRSYGHNKVEVDSREEGDLTYVTLQTGLWTKMYVVFQSASEQTIRDAERRFIDAANKGFGDFSKSSLVTMNSSAGGEGPLGRKGPYYLYVLRSG